MDNLPSELRILTARFDLYGDDARALQVLQEAADEIEKLRDALEMMIGAFDTRISRRRISSDLAKKAREMARKALPEKISDLKEAK